MNRFFPKLFIISIFIFYSCATPSSPTGGPPDKEGPKIESSEPKTGTVNFKGDEIELHFSEFVKRGSLNQALTIEPDIGLKHDLDWGRKSVAIKFEGAIPASTTLIITVGTDFADVNGNTMASPYKVAVSTGPEIDKGKLIGRVLDARTGKGTDAKRLLLYRNPVDLTQPANYIGESDTSGTVNFSYLREGKYKAFWVDDRNRDKIWEPDNERAQPFGNEFITLNKAGEDTLGTLFIANSDTSKPALQGVGLFSSRRLRLRFSENVALTDSTRLEVQDSTGQSFSIAYPLYVSPDEQYVLFAHSDKELAADHSFLLSVKNIADNAGNIQPANTQSFTGSSQKDTTAQRIIGTSLTEGIFPTESVDIIYAKPITKAAVRDSLKIVVGDSMRKSWKNLQIQENKVRILPKKTWKNGIDYEFHVWDPIKKDYSTFTPTIWHKPDLGSIFITFADSTKDAAGRPTHLSLQTAQGRMVVDTTFTKEITLKNLAPVPHQLQMYQDLNKNGTWDYGNVSPYKAPEPYYIRNNIPVQKGLTSNLSVSFKQ